MNATAAAKPLRVVIVDDTPDLRDLLRMALESGGFDVVAEAGDGAEAIEVARVHLPDVILLDLAMPVMDGLEALPTLRELCPDAKIVVLSGFGAAQMTRRAMAAGADGYLQKGVPLRTILDYVRDVTTDDAPHPPRALTVVPDEPPQRVEQAVAPAAGGVGTARAVRHPRGRRRGRSTACQRQRGRQRAARAAPAAREPRSTPRRPPSPACWSCTASSGTGHHSRWTSSTTG